MDSNHRLWCRRLRRCSPLRHRKNHRQERKETMAENRTKSKSQSSSECVIRGKDIKGEQLHYDNMLRTAMYKPI